MRNHLIGHIFGRDLYCTDYSNLNRLNLLLAFLNERLPQPKVFPKKAIKQL